MIHVPTIAHLRFIPVTGVSTGRFREVVDPSRYAALAAAVVRTREHLVGRTVWNISSSTSDGAAQLIRSLTGYALGAGIDARWLAIQGRPELATVGKRLHNHLLGFDGDGGTLSSTEHEIYERSLAPASVELVGLVRPRDLVLLHGPVAAGLAPELAKTRARIVWRSHVGLESANARAENAWTFVSSYLRDVDAFVLSCRTTLPKGMPPERVEVIPAAVDPLSPKNNFMTRAESAAILISAGLMSGYSTATPFYVHPSGTLRLVSHRAELVQLEPIAPWTRLVLQVSRWDRLRDLTGVMEAFAGLVPAETQAHLMIAGPEVTDVPDDPEGADVFHRAVAAWESLPEPARRRVHLATLPIRDADENAAVVNALQRWAQVAVQKSLAEGSGLTVAEAMWKSRPVVATRVGAIA